MTLRNSVVPAALALAGCLPSESSPPPALSTLTYQTEMQGGECKTENVTYEVRGSVHPTTAPPIAKSNQRNSSLIVTVGEAASVVSCTADSVQIASPGAELTSESFPADASVFSLSVPSVIIGGQRSDVWVEALLDENDNGTCDDGELTGSVNLPASELGDIAIELSDEGCPARG